MSLAYLTQPKNHMYKKIIQSHFYHKDARKMQLDCLYGFIFFLKLHIIKID